MSDRPTCPSRPATRARPGFGADLAAYLGSLFLHELGELPEATRVALRC